MESTANGLLRKILATEGATVPVGYPIGIIGSADEDIGGLIVDEAPAPAQASGDAHSAEVASPAPISQTQPAADGERVKVSPVARKLAEERGIELSQVKGTGPGGRVTLASLKKHSGLNASYRGDYLETYPYIHLGMAIATEQGLMVPAIVNAQDKSLVDLAIASKDLAERAGQGRLRQEEYTGTFSTSNLGMFGVDEFSAIILPPQAATLAISAVKKRPVVAADDQVVVRQMMKVTLSIDHRVSDGVESAQFLAEMKRLLETPALLLVT
ncbi:Dihydrolipoyllysine-residue acetyltransferase component of pyruvate dehydrogenase complex, mitochondrial (Fragments) [Geodia barretti]|uniref:Dihydrolipoyllysine-residue acetyltransferase component of pyruvate dehydrogenase complex, mitochondrial (Fragments) n=1 Tax=Geodia barretti TaxID=519541 RepID=A0AA35X363_GEOBA|nr:Dihydrolipoyllysine-residue acetyltransferase component of pyruvate dehydrogenase complex, mitochondrial (Fragments) [Geodia barretti]